MGWEDGRGGEGRGGVGGLVVRLGRACLADLGECV